jgi:hypothetical protein
LPTNLPPRRRVDEKPSLARTIFDFLFNAILVTSALILTFIVLVREEQSAFGRQQSPAQAIEQAAQQGLLDTTGERLVTPPSN